MKFYLGTHKAAWLGRINVPLFVSRRTLAVRRRLSRALGPWALDSGGFTELNLFGGWQTPLAQYVAEVRRFSEEIGEMEWAAPQDWMCEPWINERTGLSVEEHQRRTVDNFLALRDVAADLPFIPVLQGWTISDYRRCLDMYDRAGVSLQKERLVGVGSVCRRQQREGGREVVGMTVGTGIRLHAFGLKLNGLKEVGHLLASSDSLAWSYSARRSPPLSECRHRSCANCLCYALAWRERVLAAIDGPQQTFLVMGA